NPEANTEGPGPVGANGPMPSAADFQARIGREIPAYARSFSDFETIRFESTLVWYEFHWWRYLELLAHTSIPLVAEDPPAAGATLNDILGGQLRRNNITLVRDKWN